MEPTTNNPRFEEWRATARHFAHAYIFAEQRARVHSHLLATQKEPGNLPAAVEKWERLQEVAAGMINAHFKRGARWQLPQAQMEAVFTAVFNEVGQTDTEPETAPNSADIAAATYFVTFAQNGV